MVHARGPFGETIVFGIQTASLFLPKDCQYLTQSHTATQSWNVKYYYYVNTYLPVKENLNYLTKDTLHKQIPYTLSKRMLLLQKRMPCRQREFEPSD